MSNLLMERLTADYGVAAIRDGEHSGVTMLEYLNSGMGVAVLSIAEGPLGVLRAMAVRCGGSALPPPGERVTCTLAYVRLVDGQAVMQVWVLRPIHEPVDNRPNYARDRGRGAIGE